MKHSKSIFKKALHKCRNDKNNEALKSIENNLKNKNVKQFWREVKNKRSNRDIPSVIDGHSCESQIIEIFSNNFLSGNDFDSPFRVEMIHIFNNINSNEKKAHRCVSSATVVKRIHRLKSGCVTMKLALIN